MEKEKKTLSKKKLEKRRLSIKVLFTFLWVFAIMFAAFYCHSPIFKTSLSNNICIITVNAVLSAMIGYTIWDYRKEYSLFNKILHYISIITVWLPMIIPWHKAVMMIDILVGLIAFCYLTFVLNTYSLNILTYAMYFFVLRGAGPSLCGYFDTGKVPCIVYVIVGIISLIFAVFAFSSANFGYNNKNTGRRENGKKHSVITQVIVFAILLLIMFSHIGNITGSVNYAFDFSEPQRITTTVIETEEENVPTGKSSRRIDYYVLAEVNGEKMKIQTTRTVYNQIETGDEIAVLIYDGALSFPYYIIEPIE